MVPSRRNPHDAEDILQQDEIMDRYRHLRAISVRHHTAALDYLPNPRFWNERGISALPRGRLSSPTARRR